MSIYFCAECDNPIDNDYHPCQEFPEGSNKLVCPECMDEIEYENEELIKEEKTNA